MAAPVWVLSVDLQTKTATFQTGLSDAARAARSSFQDIKSEAGGMGKGVSYSMMESRHSVMLLGEEFGVHLPRALTSFIAGLGPLGPALNMAFPFLAIAVGATLLIQHLVKLHEAGEKLTDDQVKFGTAAQTAFNSLDDKLLQAQIRADELRGNHLAALHDQIELIDHQSLEELVHSFEEVAKAADVVMKELTGHWYTFGSGSDYASKELDKVVVQYNSLMAQHRGEDATKLLWGKRDDYQAILDVQKQLASITYGPDKHMVDQKDTAEYERLRNELKASGVGWTEKEVTAQQQLVDALNDQITATVKGEQLRAADVGNAKTADAKSDDKTGAAAAKKAAEEQTRLQQELLANIKQGEQDTIAATEAGSTERLAAIQHAMDLTRDLYGEGSHIYKEFAAEYLKTTQQMDKELLDVDHAFAEEDARQKQEAGQEEARHDEAMGELSVSRLKQHFTLLNSIRRASAADTMTQETLAANEEYAVKYVALAREIDALDKSGKDYSNKLKALQDKETELVKAHEQQVTDIKEKAEEARNQRILAAEQQLTSSMARGLTQSIMGHQSWAKTLNQLGNEVVSGMIENSIKIMLQQDKEKLADAKKAATSAYATGEKIGGPAGIVLGPVFAAAAFAGVMAFEEGGQRAGQRAR